MLAAMAAFAVVLLCLSFSPLALGARQLLQQTLTVQDNNANGPPVFNESNPTFIRFVVIGDFGRQKSFQSIGMKGCSVDGFFGDNEEQGGSQQRETAFLMNEVCGQIGGCKFIVNTGDNFYACGVYPGDDSRFKSDWKNVYRNKDITPHIAHLKWYTTIGNHDVVINGSVEAQVAYSKKNKGWVLPKKSFSKTWKMAGVSLTGVFFDSVPFVTKYNSPDSPYYQQYYIQHHTTAYVNKTLDFVATELSKSKATYKFLVTHFPLFGTNKQYGLPSASVYPGEFGAWARTVKIVDKYKPVAYLNGHDHTMSLGNRTDGSSNRYTSFVTSGAGSWGETGDSCGDPGSYLYSNGGNGGFVIVTADKETFRVDYYTLGSNYPQCTVTSFANGSDPITSPNCALGQPNSCCTSTSSDPNFACY